MYVSALKNKTHLGLSDEIMKKWEIPTISPLLTDQDITQLSQKGYLILDIPDELQLLYPATNSIQNFNTFFQTISNDYNFDCKNSEIVKCSESNSLAERRMANKFAYYTDKIDPNNPFDIYASLGKSSFALKGGKLISSSCGMGPGTTFTQESNHINFCFSQFIQSIMASFYKNQKMLCVLERFRIKTSNQWKGAYHVDVSGSTLISTELIQHLNL